jgi:hypothetical protein
VKMTPILSLIESAVQDGLKEHAEAVLEDSNARAPKDTREMIESGFVDVDDLTVQVGYTDFVAKIQHENLEFQHPNGGGPKFLENAALAARSDLESTIGKHVRQVLGG